MSVTLNKSEFMAEVRAAAAAAAREALGLIQTTTTATAPAAPTPEPKAEPKPKRTRAPKATATPPAQPVQTVTPPPAAPKAKAERKAKVVSVIAEAWKNRHGEKWATIKAVGRHKGHSVDNADEGLAYIDAIIREAEALREQVRKAFA